MKYAQKNTTMLKTQEILELFISQEKLSLQEMVLQTGLPRTSLLRMVASLEEMGFLEKDPEGRYGLGLVFLRFGDLVAKRLDIRTIALPVMRKLQEESDEAVNLVVLKGDEGVYIEKVDTFHPVKVYTDIGRRAPLYGGACPRVLLAYMPPAEQERYIRETELVRYAEGTILDKDELRRELAKVRRDGYAYSGGELRDFTAAVAAPIYNQTGAVVASLSLAGLAERFKGENLTRLIKLVKEAAFEISRRLGWRPAGD